MDVEEDGSHDDTKKSREQSLHSLLKVRLKQLLEKTEDE
jgi:hypothetical protein